MNHTIKYALIDFFVNYLKERIFPKTYKNPNGCPIHGTFYVSHEYTNYAMINKLWNQGHEISVHSITKRKPESWWEGNATIEDWFDEMVGQVRYPTPSVRLPPRLIRPSKLKRVKESDSTWTVKPDYSRKDLAA